VSMAPRAGEKRKRVPHPSISKGAGVRVPRNPLKRYYGRGDLHFVTFSCHRRKPYLGTNRARNRFVKLLDEVRTRWNFALIGYVVMPEHVHLLISEPTKGDPSRMLQVLKQKTSRALRGRKKKPAGQLSLPLADVLNATAHLWQRRFYDFNVWSAKKLREKLQYMHLNPVKRKLVSHPQDWPWSSWSHYEKGQHGMIHVDSSDPRRTMMERDGKPHP